VANGGDFPGFKGQSRIILRVIPGAVRIDVRIIRIAPTSAQGVSMHNLSKSKRVAYHQGIASYLEVVTEQEKAASERQHYSSAWRRVGINIDGSLDQ